MTEARRNLTVSGLRGCPTLVSGTELSCLLAGQLLPETLDRWLSLPETVLKRDSAEQGLQHLSSESWVLLPGKAAGPRMPLVTHRQSPASLACLTDTNTGCFCTNLRWCMKFSKSFLVSHFFALDCGWCLGATHTLTAVVSLWWKSLLGKMSKCIGN